MKNDFLRAYYLGFDWSGWIALIKNTILVTKGMSWPVSSDKWKAPQVNKKTAIKISGELNEFREDASFLFIFKMKTLNQFQADISNQFPHFFIFLAALKNKRWRSLGSGFTLGEKGKKIGEWREPRGTLGRTGKGAALSPSPGHHWARFVRRYFSCLTPFFAFFPHCGACCQAKDDAAK